MVKQGIYLIVATLICSLLIYFSSSLKLLPLNIIFGLLFTLFLPGFCLLYLIINDPREFTPIEYLSLVLVLSFCFLSIVGILLTALGFLITHETTFISLLVAILVVVILGMLRRRFLPLGLFDISEFREKEWELIWNKKTAVILFVVLIIFILLLLIFMQRPAENFINLYWGTYVVQDFRDIPTNDSVSGIAKYATLTIENETIGILLLEKNQTWYYDIVLISNSKENRTLKSSDSFFIGDRGFTIYAIEPTGSRLVVVSIPRVTQRSFFTSEYVIESKYRYDTKVNVTVYVDDEPLQKKQIFLKSWEVKKDYLTLSLTPGRHQIKIIAQPFFGEETDISFWTEVRPK
ncbi:MAG: DUF1616 domain-containing protein [Candidatus Micrarchaeia archaeon]